MADHTWPASLPQNPDVYNTYTRTLRTNLISSETDGGEPRLRARYTKILFDVSFGIYVTKAQLNTFQNFYTSTLNRGVSRFNWKDFELDQTTPASNVEYQFNGENPYLPTIKGPDNYILSLNMIMFPA